MLKLIVVVLALFVCSVNAQSAPCVPANGGAASNVLGQADFTSGAAGTGLNQFSFPIDLEVDILTFKFFVSDNTNNRVLRFTDTQAFTDGATAEASFGGSGAASATTLNGPNNLAIQNSVLFVSDTGNNRVLRLDDASNAPSGSSFSGVLGQADFVSNNASNLTTGFNGPEGLALDFSGNLYVADTGSRTVEVFASAATAANGAASTRSFGTFLAAACSATDFQTPDSITSDTFTDTLWISDRGCNRITGYSTVSTQASGAAFTFVIGQADFTSSATGCSATSLNQPSGLSYDGNTQTLWVADHSNNRVLGYSSALSVLTNPTANAAAVFVFGQADFATCTAGAISASSLNGPYGVHYDSFFDFDLFVVDSGNNRTLRFECPDSTSSSITASVSVTGSISVSNSNSNSNSGSHSASVSASGSASGSASSSGSGSITASWTVTSSNSASPSASQSSTISASNSPVFCGNGAVNTGEECDPGVGNFGGSTCCNPSCHYKRINSKCGPLTGNPCVKRDRCRKNSSTGVVSCVSGINKRQGKFCKTSSITEGKCDGSGTCVAV